MGWAQKIEDCTDPSDYAYCTCVVYSCGYSQPNRKHISIGWLENGTAECDCSSGVSWWLYKGGFIDDNPWFATSNEREWLTNHGFIAIDANTGFVKMQRNDVLLRDRNESKGILGHTALYIGDGMQAEALRDENHQAGYEGTTPGDQDGGETVVRKLTYDWDWVIRKIDQPLKPTERVKLPMTFMFTCDGKHADHVWFYDGGKIYRVYTTAQQDCIRDAYNKCTVNSIPFFHLPDGDRLFEVVGCVENMV